MEAEDEWKIEMKHWEQCCIYRVPEWMKDIANCKAYKPSLVKLGPLGEDRGQAHYRMEEHKRRAMMRLVKRSGKPLEEFIAAIEQEEVVNKLRGAYGYLGAKWNKWESSRFIITMLTDGCFLLEIMGIFTRGENLKNYAPNDPVFSKRGFSSLYLSLRSDMIVMENQIPLLVLQKILEVIGDKAPIPVDRLNHTVLEFLGYKGWKTKEILCCHALDILHESFIAGREEMPSEKEETLLRAFLLRFLKTLGWPAGRPLRRSILRVFGLDRYLAIQLPWRVQSKQAQKEASDVWEEATMPCATDLSEAGVRFRKNQSNSVLDVDFKHGVLSMPLVVVNNGSEKEWLNLMAFERLHYDAGTNVTAYMIFMDNLISTERDVELLISKGLIINLLSSNEEAAKLFNKLSKGAVMVPSSKLNLVRRRLNAHCAKAWNKWRANFVQTYLSNPWVFISLVAAVFLLVATFLQTIYTVLPFYTRS
ncbi:hypothetical protein ACP70R_008234 [Stipagrostis hirtigluma subsp. patula]